MKRQVFFSFHYSNDNWRASQVRNMGIVSGDSTFSDNDWEEVKLKSDAMIKLWIDSQMAKRSCVVVLIGEKTAGRKWINYEIEKAIELNKGIVGIYIHNLKDRFGNQSNLIILHYLELANRYQVMSVAIILHSLLQSMFMKIFKVKWKN